MENVKIIRIIENNRFIDYKEYYYKLLLSPYIHINCTIHVSKSN